MILNLWGKNCTGSPDQMSCVSDIDISVRNSNKIAVMNSNGNNIIVGGHHNTKNCTKGSQLRKVEKHCYRGRKKSKQRTKRREIYLNLNTHTHMYTHTYAHTHRVVVMIVAT